MSTVATEIHPREVVRCRRCVLVQFRTLSDLCRRCFHPLPPAPRLEVAPPNGGFSVVGPRSSGPVAFSPDRNPQRDTFQPRGKTTRELTIGRKLRELREARHLTQQEMAGRAGVPRTYISRIENARLLPGPLMLHRIANALEVAIFELLPQPKNGNGPAAEETSFWHDLAESFSQLRPEEMSRVLFFVRNLVDQSDRQALVPELAAS